MTAHADKGHLRQQLIRVRTLIRSAPSTLSFPLRALENVILAVQGDGAPDQPQTTMVSGPGGTWQVSRFSVDGHQACVSIRWPSKAPEGIVDWLFSEAANLRLTLEDRPHRNEIWIYLGP